MVKKNTNDDVVVVEKNTNDDVVVVETRVAAKAVETVGASVQKDLAAEDKSLAELLRDPLFLAMLADEIIVDERVE